MDGTQKVGVRLGSIPPAQGGSGRLAGLLGDRDQREVAGPALQAAMTDLAAVEDFAQKIPGALEVAGLTVPFPTVTICQPQRRNASSSFKRATRLATYDCGRRRWKDIGREWPMDGRISKTKAEILRVSPTQCPGCPFSSKGAWQEHHSCTRELL